PGELGAGRDSGRVAQNGDPPRLRDELVQDFEPFHVQLRGKNTYPRRVAARSRQAGRKPTAYHVIGHADDGDGLGRALRRSDGGVAEGDNEINVLRDEFTDQRGRSLAAGLGPQTESGCCVPLPSQSPSCIAETVRRRSPAHPFDWAATPRLRARDLVARLPRAATRPRRRGA